MSCEPVITIFGKELTIGQSMTVRVAIESFASDLQENGLGDDEHGKRMVDSYMKNINEIRTLFFGCNPWENDYQRETNEN